MAPNDTDRVFAQVLVKSRAGEKKSFQISQTQPKLMGGALNLQIFWKYDSDDPAGAFSVHTHAIVVLTWWFENVL